MFCRSLFVHFLLAIVLSVLLRFTDSDYPFSIFKLFLDCHNVFPSILSHLLDCIFSQFSTADAISRGRPAYTTRAHEFIPNFWFHQWCSSLLSTFVIVIVWLCLLFFITSWYLLIFALKPCRLKCIVKSSLKVTIVRETLITTSLSFLIFSMKHYLYA
jgi:hypothetical protein